MKKTSILFALSLIVSMSYAGLSQAATYTVDRDHTTVSFKIRHLFSNVTGVFREFEGVVDYEPGKPETWTASGTIQVASLDTNVKERDKHLLSPDFFDAQKYPTLSFTTSKVLESSADRAKVEGLLTIRDIQKPVVLDIAIHGIGKDPWGNVRGGFTATTRINRKDYGLTWNQTLETGQLLVGEEVEITIELETLLKS